MRVALCLTGMAGGNSAKQFGGQMWDGNPNRVIYPVPDFEIGLEHYQKHLFAHQDVDVFIHTWNPEMQGQLESAYSPKGGIYEADKVFHEANKGKASGDPAYPDGIKSKTQITVSRWYSIAECMRLKREYEETNGFKYDAVMIGRFDMAWLTDVKLSRFDMDHFYASNWCVMRAPGVGGIRHENWYFQGWDKKLKAGEKITHTHIGYPHDPNYRALADYWFFSSSENMDAFGRLYEKINGYLSRIGPSNHELSLLHLQKSGMLSKLKFAFHIHDDCHLVRHLVHDWRKKK